MGQNPAMLRTWWGVAVSGAALLVAYYALPVGVGGGRLWAGLVLTVACLVALAAAIVVQARRELRGARGARIGTLTIMLFLVVVLFALAYYLLEGARPGQLADLSTRTDALYFTLSTVATIGYGDVHAAGQAARMVVSVQIVFDLVLVGALVRTIAMRVRRRNDTRTGRP